MYVRVGTWKNSDEIKDLSVVGVQKTSVDVNNLTMNGGKT